MRNAPLVSLAWVALSACGGESAPEPPAAPPVVAGPAVAESVVELSTLGYASSTDPLWPLGRASGLVTGPDGRALESFSLRVLRWDPYGGVLVGECEFPSAPGGAFELDRLPDGLCRIEARAPGHAPNLSASFRTRADATTRGVGVRLSPGGVLRGRVVDAATGAPIPRASVVADAEHERDLWLPVEEPWNTVHTEADGAFVLENRTPGCHLVLVAAEGFALAHVDGVEVGEGRQSTIEIELIAGATLVGTVRGDGGAPWPGAIVQLNPADLNQLFGSHQAGADRAGRFRIEHVAPGTYTLMATRAGDGNPFVALRDMQHSEINLRLADGETREVDLSLEGREGVPTGARRAPVKD